VIVALLAAAEIEKELAAGFEEEGVPLRCEPGSGEPLVLAREAARRSPLGLGIGGDARLLVLALAAAPSRPYLEASSADARRFGHAAARVAAHRPLPDDVPGG
jgi:hypothetical protein